MISPEPRWRWLEAVGDGFFLGLLVLMVLLLFLVGCSSTQCPPPEVVTQVETVEIPVLVKGEPLPICRAELETCNQDADLEVVKCIGRNVQALIVCHDQNAGTIAAHNQAIE